LQKYFIRMTKVIHKTCEELVVNLIWYFIHTEYFKNLIKKVSGIVIRWSQFIAILALYLNSFQREFARN